MVPPPAQALDLGTGAGIPGLVLALHWADSRWVLLDANQRRAAALERAVDEIGVSGRVEVYAGRAEAAARDPALRGAFDLVVARGFGRPAVTAECAAAFLYIGGVLLVSEPPDDDPARWPEAGLRSLGMVDGGRIGSVRRIEQAIAAGDAVPRRVGMPGRRPLW